MGWILEDLVRVDQSHPINTFPFKIGRNAQANIICRDVKISKHHAVITTNNGHLFITDTSSNGVYLNDKPLQRNIPIEINNDDTIALCVSKELMGTFNIKELFIFKLKVDQASLMETPPSSTDGIAEDINLENEKDVQEIKKEVVKELQPVASTSKESKTLFNLKVDLDNSLPFSEVSSNNFAGITDDVNMILDSLESQTPNQTLEIGCENAANKKGHDDSDVQIIPEEKSEVIVIDDDDDDMLLSQLYIKTEPGEPVDEEYLQIKREVAEMDKYDSEVLRSPITIMDEDSSDSVNSSELLKLLGSSAVGANGKSPELLFDDEEQETAKATNAPKETKNLKEISENIKSKLKQNKPEVINALPLTSKLHKRKYDEPVKNKETNKTKANDSKSSKRRKTEPKDESKSKLKSSKLEQSKSNSHESHHAPVKVKNSKSRGSFLIDTSLNKAQPASVPALPPVVMPRIPKKLTFATADAHMAPVTVAGTSMAAIGPIALCNSRTDPRFSRVSYNHASYTALPTPVLDNKQTEIPSSSWREHPRQSERHSSGLHSSHSNKTANIIHEHKSFILRLCAWKNTFFTQAGRIDITAIWSDVEGTLLTKMPSFYSDYKYYQAAMQTVVLSDLFSDVYNEYHLTPFAKKATRRYRGSLGTRAIVTKVTQHSDHTELLCYYYTGHKELGDKFIDCSLLNFIVSRGPNQEARTFFGVVAWTTSVQLRDTDQINDSLRSQCKSYPWHKHTFSMMIKKTSSVQPTNNIMCRSFGSIRRHLSRLCAIKKVEGPVAQQILSPNSVKFVIPEFSVPRPRHFVRMNAKQEEVVTQTMRFCTPRSDLRYFLIQGPPGTGKSDLVVNIALNLLQEVEKRTAVLLLAQSNAAVDTLMRRIEAVRNGLPEQQKHGIKMVRLGQRSVIAQDLQGFHVDDHVSRYLRTELFSISPHLREPYKLLEEEIQALSSNRSRDLDEILLKKQEELANFVKDHYLRQYKSEAARVRDLVYERANIICSTLGSSYSFQNNRIQLQFKCCIIDEATQATEPDTLLPLTLGVQKFILVGDTEQLPPHNNLVPKEYHFSQSLFSRLKKSLLSPSGQNAVYMLNEQYRMREEICSFPNRWFYSRKLITVPRPIREDIKPLLPYLVFELGEDQQKTSTYVNHQEIDTVLAILSTIGELKLVNRLSVGIITPYNHQRLEFRKKLQGLRLNDKINVQVQTIDGFQGQEQDIILLSLVLKLSNTFVNDAQRLNVALTRARSCLYVLGSSVLFNSASLMHDLQRDAQQRGVYIRVPKHIDGTTFRHHLFL